MRQGVNIERKRPCPCPPGGCHASYVFAEMEFRIYRNGPGVLPGRFDISSFLKYVTHENYNSRVRQYGPHLCKSVY
jgi:hypothetical protein